MEQGDGGNFTGGVGREFISLVDAFTSAVLIVGSAIVTATNTDRRSKCELPDLCGRGSPTLM